MEPFLGPWGHFWGHFGLFWSMVGLSGAQHDPRRPKRPQKTPKYPKIPQNDPKMTQNDPKMTRNRFSQKCSYIISDHFWWFGVISGFFERVLVIFGPRNAFKWPYLGSKTTQKWAKNRFPQKWFTWLLGILGVVWGHFRLLWAVFGLQWPQSDPKTTPKMTSSWQHDPKMTPKWQRGALPTFQAVGG